MKTKQTVVVVGLLAVFSSFLVAAPLGTAFTYQGNLTDGGQPASGNYDLKFTLYDSASGGTAVGGPITNSPVTVTDGLFTVTLDFGSGVFNGDARWLAIGVRANGGGGFTTLNPRQPLNPSPYALHAPSAGTLTGNPVMTGTATFNPASGPPFLVGNSNKVANLHADLLDGLNATAFWQRSGNAGTAAGPDFVGTTDNQPLEMRVNTLRALRLEPHGNRPNLIGGAVNFADNGAVGVTIGGGGDVNAVNQVSSSFGTIGGGKGNAIAGSTDPSVIAGGEGNAVLGNADYAAISGGLGNSVGPEADYSFVGGGRNNENGENADYAVIAGGYNNTNGYEADYSAICGGEGNTIRDAANFSVIGGGRDNLIDDNADWSVISGGEGSSIVHSDHSAIGGGLNNHIWEFTDDSTLSGGRENEIHWDSMRATIGGGFQNVVSTNADYSVIGGGEHNRINQGSWHSIIGGGLNNSISSQADQVTITGGERNEIGYDSDHAWIGGGLRNVISDNADKAAITGGQANEIGYDSDHAWIGGGQNNIMQASAWWSAIVCGEGSSISNAQHAAIGGGLWNRIWTLAHDSTIGGGRDNVIQDDAWRTTIAGGAWNLISTNADYATIGGGENNLILSDANHATIVGGAGNSVSTNADFATVAGGGGNEARAAYAFAAGHNAKASHRGSFVWADDDIYAFYSTRENEFAIRARGGLWLESNRGIRLNGANTPLITRGYDVFDDTSPWEKRDHGRWGLFMESQTLVAGIPDLGGKQFQVAKYQVNGNRTELMRVDQSGTVTATAFNPTSDRNAKANFQPVNSREMLEKVATLPISRWNFKADSQTPHLGPVAQDFHAAFGLGTDDKHIATVDADGVALAAIQGLNQKLTEELQRRDAENAELKSRLEKLEQLLNERLSGGAL